MEKVFKIIGYPNVYINPRLGRINLAGSFSNEEALEWYKDENFPYIKPLPGAEKLLAKEKVDMILRLLEKADSPEEIEILKASKPESKKIQELLPHL